jgi:hypothetical protein
MTLSDKYQTYLNLLPSVQGIGGFIHHDECDSLIFSGLLGCVPEANVKIDAAFDAATGLWHRRPLGYPECCPSSSASTISKDQLIGLAWYAYANKRLDISEHIVSYAISHWMIMGQAPALKDKLGSCLLTPGLLATYAEISYRLGGPNRWWLRNLPQWESSGVTGFQAHLSVLHILLRQKLTGSISSSHVSILNAHVSRQPNNPLFNIAAGTPANLAIAELVLANETWWPSDRLPASTDRYEPWLTQRDFGSDWQPDHDVPKIHSGGDFLFCCWLLNQVKNLS